MTIFVACCTVDSSVEQLHNANRELDTRVYQIHKGCKLESIENSVVINYQLEKEEEEEEESSSVHNSQQFSPVAESGIKFAYLHLYLASTCTIKYLYNS